MTALREALEIMHNDQVVMQDPTKEVDALMEYLRTQYTGKQLMEVVRFLERLPRGEGDGDMLELMACGDQDEMEEKLGKLPGFALASEVLESAFDEICRSA